VEKYSGVEEAAGDYMVRAHLTLGTQGYKHTLRICNTCCFSTATMAARTRLNVTLYLQCLSWYYMGSLIYFDSRC